MPAPQRQSSAGGNVGGGFVFELDPPAPVGRIIRLSGHIILVGGVRLE
jgi:hypothetical protein